MAKRTRQELRTTPTEAPYRRTRPPSAPPPVLDLPMPPPPVASVAPPVELPDMLAAMQSALHFAAAALVELTAPAALVHREPTSPEPPPGRAPRGDARSLRSESQFALIYRHGAAVVSRRGKLGEHGVWRVIDYPNPAAAAHAYALECSRLAEQGFHDVT